MAFRYSGNGWRVAGSIRTFGDQIMALRGHTNSYSVDGTLGDLAHSNRISDHNPDDEGIVRALDFYEDKPARVDEVAEALRQSRDPRLKYFIHDTRMFSSYVGPQGQPAWTWRPYGGVNGHINHGHLSVVADDRAEQTHAWAMPGASVTPGGDDDMAIPAWTLDLDEAGWRALQRAGIAAGTEASVVDYWVINGAKRTLAEHQDASEDMFPKALAALAKFTDNPDTTSSSVDLTGYSKVGHTHKGAAFTVK